MSQSNGRNSRNRRKSRPQGRSNSQKILKDMGLRKDPQLMRVGRNLGHSFLRQPGRPLPGAMLSLRQIASTFTVSSGLTNVGGSDSAAQLIQAGATTVNAAIAFCLADLAQVSTLAALFDQYRIEKVKLHIKSRNNAVSTFNTASPNGAVPTGYVVIDRDDATALTSTSDAMQYNNCVTFNGEEDVEVELVPSITMAAYASGAFSGYTSELASSHWIDIANTSVPLYGVKICIGPLSASTTSSWAWDIIPEYVVSFKNSR